MAIIYNKMIVDGAGLVKGGPFSSPNIFYVEDGIGYRGDFKVSDGTGKAQDSTYIVACYDKPKFYSYTEITLSHVANYMISGTCTTLPNHEVWLTTAIGDTIALENATIDKAYSDNNGDFVFEKTPEISGRAYLVIQAPMNFAALESHEFTNIKTQVIESSGLYLRYAIFSTHNAETCKACHGTGKIEFDPSVPLYSYNGIEAPPLPAEALTYKNAYILGSLAYGNSPLTLFLTDEDMYYSLELSGFGFANAQPYYTIEHDAMLGSTKWVKTDYTSSANASSVSWSNVDIYNTNYALHRAKDGDPTPAAVCGQCNGTGYETGLSGTFNCRSCSGDGGLPVTDICPTCNGTSINSNAYAVPRCSIEGTWFGLNYGAVSIHVSYLPDSMSENIPINSLDAIRMLEAATSFSPNLSNSFSYSFTDTGIYGGYMHRSQQKWVLWTTVTDNNAPDITITSVQMSEGSTQTGGAVCLSGDTLIATPEGDVELQNLNIHDQVLCSSGTTTVSFIDKGTFNGLYHILYYFDNGTIIDETGPHRFFNCEQGFFQYLSGWNNGEHAIDINGNQTALVKRECVYEPAKRYGLWTETGDYYANGLLSGQTSKNQEILSTASAEQLVTMAQSLPLDKLLQILNIEGGSLLP